MSHQDHKEVEKNNSWQTVNPPEGWKVGSESPFTLLDEYVGQAIDRAHYGRYLVDEAKNQVTAYQYLTQLYARLLTRSCFLTRRVMGAFRLQHKEKR